MTDMRPSGFAAPTATQRAAGPSAQRSNRADRQALLRRRVSGLQRGELGLRVGEQARSVRSRRTSRQLVRTEAENDDGTTNAATHAIATTHHTPQTLLRPHGWGLLERRVRGHSCGRLAAIDSASHSGESTSTCPAEPRTSARTQAGSATRRLIWRWPPSIAVSSVTG